MWGRRKRSKASGRCLEFRIICVHASFGLESVIKNLRISQLLRCQRVGIIEFLVQSSNPLLFYVF